MFKPHTQSEDGASLVVVLIFISLFGLILASLLTEGSASFGFSNTVADHESKVYAADAGVSFGIQQLRQNNEICPGVGMGSGPGPTVPGISVNGSSVSVSCNPTEGSTVGAAGFAVITTSSDPANSLTLNLTGPGPTIGGAVFVNGGITLGGSALPVQGDFYQRDPGSGCSGLNSPLIGVSPPYSRSCAPFNWTAVKPAHDAPDTTGLTARLPNGDGGNSCRVFQPGVYSQAPALVNQNYFASGVYYFTFPGQWTIGSTVIGGQRDVMSNEQSKLFPVPGSLPTCAQQEAAPRASF